MRRRLAPDLSTKMSNKNVSGPFGHGRGRQHMAKWWDPPTHSQAKNGGPKPDKNEQRNTHIQKREYQGATTVR